MISWWDSLLSIEYFNEDGQDEQAFTILSFVEPFIFKLGSSEINQQSHLDTGGFQVIYIFILAWSSAATSSAVKRQPSAPAFSCICSTLVAPGIGKAPLQISQLSAT